VSSFGIREQASPSVQCETQSSPPPEQLGGPPSGAGGHLSGRDELGFHGAAEPVAL